MDTELAREIAEHNAAVDRRKAAKRAAKIKRRAAEGAEVNNPPFNARSNAPPRRDESGPGLGDDVPCEKCGAVALDTGLECSECGHDNYEAMTGKPFKEPK